ncbi:hypothetical protein Tco_1172493 [Tanacetum coccineum]
MLAAVIISQNSIDQQRCGCQDKENKEATRCEHYGGGSSNRVALDVAREEVRKSALRTRLSKDVSGCDVMITEDGRGGGHLVFLIGGRISLNSIDRQSGFGRGRGGGRESERSLDGNERLPRDAMLHVTSVGNGGASDFGRDQAGGRVSGKVLRLDIIHVVPEPCSIKGSFESLFQEKWRSALRTRLGKDVSGCDVMITGSTLDQHVWLSRQEENKEATWCERYGGGSSNRVALNVAGEEVVSSGEVKMWKSALRTRLSKDVSGCDVMITEDDRGGGHLVFLIGGRISQNSIDRQRCGCQDKKRIKKQHDVNIMAVEVQIVWLWTWPGRKS